MKFSRYEDKLKAMIHPSGIEYYRPVHGEDSTKSYENGFVLFSDDYEAYAAFYGKPARQALAVCSEIAELTNEPLVDVLTKYAFAITSPDFTLIVGNRPEKDGPLSEMARLSRDCYLPTNEESKSAPSMRHRYTRGKTPTYADLVYGMGYGLESPISWPQSGDGYISTPTFVPVATLDRIVLGESTVRFKRMFACDALVDGYRSNVVYHHHLIDLDDFVPVTTGYFERFLQFEATIEQTLDVIISGLPYNDQAEARDKYAEAKRETLAFFKKLTNRNHIGFPYRMWEYQGLFYTNASKPGENVSISGIGTSRQLIRFEDYIIDTGIEPLVMSNKFGTGISTTLEKVPNVQKDVKAYVPTADPYTLGCNRLLGRIPYLYTYVQAQNVNDSCALFHDFTKPEYDKSYELMTKTHTHKLLHKDTLYTPVMKAANRNANKYVDLSHQYCARHSEFFGTEYFGKMLMTEEKDKNGYLLLNGIYPATSFNVEDFSAEWIAPDAVACFSQMLRDLAIAGADTEPAWDDSSAETKRQSMTNILSDTHYKKTIGEGVFDPKSRHIMNPMTVLAALMQSIAGNDAGYDRILWLYADLMPAVQRLSTLGLDELTMALAAERPDLPLKTRIESYKHVWFLLNYKGSLIKPVSRVLSKTK